jgi:hypothetical protein
VRNTSSVVFDLSNGLCSGLRIINLVQANEQRSQKEKQADKSGSFSKSIDTCPVFKEVLPSSQSLAVHRRWHCNVSTVTRSLWLDVVTSLSITNPFYPNAKGCPFCRGVSMEGQISHPNSVGVH